MSRIYISSQHIRLYDRSGVMPVCPIVRFTEMAILTGMPRIAPPDDWKAAIPNRECSFPVQQRDYFFLVLDNWTNQPGDSASQFLGSDALRLESFPCQDGSPDITIHHHNMVPVQLVLKSLRHLCQNESPDITKKCHSARAAN